MECSLNSTQGYQKYMKIKQKEIVRIKAENSKQVTKITDEYKTLLSINEEFILQNKQRQERIIWAALIKESWHKHQVLLAGPARWLTRQHSLSQ